MNNARRIPAVMLLMVLVFGTACATQKSAERVTRGRDGSESQNGSDPKSVPSSGITSEDDTGPGFLLPKAGAFVRLVTGTVQFGQRTTTALPAKDRLEVRHAAGGLVEFALDTRNEKQQGIVERTTWEYRKSGIFLIVQAEEAYSGPERFSTKYLRPMGTALRLPFPASKGKTWRFRVKSSDDCIVSTTLDTITNADEQLRIQTQTLRVIRVKEEVTSRSTEECPIQGNSVTKRVFWYSPEMGLVVKEDVSIIATISKPGATGNQPTGEIKTAFTAELLLGGAAPTPIKP